MENKWNDSSDGVMDDTDWLMSYLANLMGDSDLAE